MKQNDEQWSRVIVQSNAICSEWVKKCKANDAVLEITFFFWIHTSCFDFHNIHVIISEFSNNSSHHVLLTGSFNISSDPPIIPVLFFFFFPSGLPPRQGSLSFTSHGVLQDNKVFLPIASQLLRGCGSARSWWAKVGPSQKTGRAHDSTSSGSPPFLVTHGNQGLNTHKFTQMFRVVGGSCGFMHFMSCMCIRMCVSQSERDWGKGAVL